MARVYYFDLAVDAEVSKPFGMMLPPLTTVGSFLEQKGCDPASGILLPFGAELFHNTTIADLAPADGSLGRLKGDPLCLQASSAATDITPAAPNEVLINVVDAMGNKLMASVCAVNDDKVELANLFWKAKAEKIFHLKVVRGTSAEPFELEPVKVLALSRARSTPTWQERAGDEACSFSVQGAIMTPWERLQAYLPASVGIGFQWLCLWMWRNVVGFAAFVVAAVALLKG